MNAASNSRTSRASDSSGRGSPFLGRCEASRRTQRTRTPPRPWRQNPSPRRDRRYAAAAGAGKARQPCLRTRRERKACCLPSAGRGSNACDRVGKGAVPAGEIAFVVELVVGVPAEDNVAEIEPRLQRAQKLLARQILSANDAIEIDDPELDVGQAARL